MNTTAETTTTGLDALFEAGAHYGVAKARRHPSVAPYVFTTKQGVDILDLEKTIELFEAAKEAMRTYGRERKQVLFVGGKPECQTVIREVAESMDMPYVASRWIGGTLTNFAEIKQRIARLDELKTARERGEHNKFTKLERLMIDREVERLERTFGGLTTMQEKIADVVLVVDPRKEHIVVKEALTAKLPLVAIASSDCNIGMVDYPVVANDASQKSVRFFVRALADAYNEGFKEASKTPVEA